MTIEKLREAQRGQPFRPFDICLADGRRFHVPHPEFLYIPPKAERTFIVTVGGEEYSIVDLLLVTSIDYRRPVPRRRSA